MDSLPRRAFLGAELPPDDEAFTARGMRIVGVLPDGMAEAAQLVGGDVVVAIADRPVRDLCELGTALRAAGALGAAELVVERGGERVARSVEVVAVARDPRVDYGELIVGGARLRTLTTRADAARAIVVVVQGIACESVEASPLSALASAWARAGYTSLLFDKRGVGDSEGGACTATDFATELADARAVIASAQGLPVVVFGHSVGGIIAAQLAARAAGVIVYGAPVMKWIDCLVDSTRRQLALRGATDDEIRARVAALHELTARGELNGRSAAYHAQLAALDIEAAWRAVTAPVLVARGEYDWVVDAGDQARVATLARGPTTILDLPGLDHLLGWHPDRDASLVDYGAGALDETLATRTIAWLDDLLAG